MTAITLSDACEINPRLKRATSGDTEVSFVPMAAVNATTGSVDGFERRRYQDISPGLTPFESGDLLVAKITPCFQNGKIAQAVTPTGIAFGSTEFHVLRARPDSADPRYILHFLRQDWVRIAGEQRMTGSGGQRRVPVDFLMTLQIPLPPIEEQRRIAAVLDKVDGLRAKRRSAHSVLKSLAGSMFIALFGDLTNPRVWPVVRLKDAVELVQIGPFGSLLHQSDYIEDGVPVINPMHIANGRVRPDSRHSVAAEHVERLHHYVLRRGDVVMGRRGEMGRCAVVGETEVGMLCGSGSLIIRPDPHRATAVYLEAVLSSAYMKRSLEHEALGVTMANLNSSIVEGLKLPLPDLGEQLRYGRLLERLSLQERKVDESERAIDQLFCSLQQRAFQGTL